MIEEEKNKIQSLIDKENIKVLDVGCGNGRYCEIFIDTCIKYVGIDIDKELIEENITNNRYKNAFYECENIIKYNTKEKFDIIILSLAFHEIDIKEQGLALMKMLKLLEKDGKIIILDPTLESDSFQGLWNIAYTNLLFFNHDYTIKHSKEVIEKAIQNNLCKPIKNDKINLKFEFTNLEKVTNMILESNEFEEVRQQKNIKEKLEIKLKEFLKSEKNIVIYDKLDITVLEKVE